MLIKIWYTIFEVHYLSIVAELILGDSAPFVAFSV